jgi:cytochrome c peroxidase
VHELSPGEPIDTPSLVDVFSSAPYFHDGRYATLRALLGDTRNGMGTTAELESEQLDALEAYLRSL